MAFRCMLSGLNYRTSPSSAVISRSAAAAAPRSVAAAVTAAAVVGLSSAPTPSEGLSRCGRVACSSDSIQCSASHSVPVTASENNTVVGSSRTTSAIVYPLPPVQNVQPASIVAVNKLQKSPVSNQQPGSAGIAGSITALEQRKQLQLQQQQQRQLHQLKRSTACCTVRQQQQQQQQQQKFVVVAATRGDRAVAIDTKLNGLRRVVCSSTSHRRLPGGQGGGQGGAPARVVPPNATGGEPLDGAASPTSQPTPGSAAVAGTVPLSQRGFQQQTIAPLSHGARHVVTGSGVVAMGSVTAPACLRVPMSGPGREKTRLSGSEQPSNGLLRLAAAPHQGSSVQAIVQGSGGVSGGATAAVAASAGTVGVGIGVTSTGGVSVVSAGAGTTFSLAATAAQGAVISNGIVAEKTGTAATAALVASKGFQLLNGSSAIATNRSLPTAAPASVTATTSTTKAIPSSAAAKPSALSTTHVTTLTPTTPTPATGKIAIVQTTAGSNSISRGGTPADATARGGPSATVSVNFQPEVSLSHSSSLSSSVSFSLKTEAAPSTTTQQATTVAVATTSPSAPTQTKCQTASTLSQRSVNVTSTAEATNASDSIAAICSSLASSSTLASSSPAPSCWSSSVRNAVTTAAMSTAPVSTNGGILPTVVGSARVVSSNNLSRSSAIVPSAMAGTTSTSVSTRLDHRTTSKSKDEGVGPSPAGSSGAIADETDRRVTEECAALQRRLDQLRRRHHQLSQRVHRVQTKSGVEVAYSELKEVVARGQEIFRMPCLMSKSGQLAAQMAQKEEKAGTNVGRHLSEQDRSRVTRRCGIHSAVISISEKLCDSSATESSSEEEDMPTKVDFFNGKQKLTPFRYATRDASAAPRHPAWRWAAQRAAMGARWTWLQAQVSELEYRIRQQHELCRQLRTSKQPCLQYSRQHSSHESSSSSAAVAAGSASASSSPSPQLSAGTATSTTLTSEGQCARSVPLNDNFRKRRLVLAQRVSSQAAESVPMDALQPSCDCAAFYPRLELCVRCSLLHAQSRRERLELCEEQRPVQLHSGVGSGGAGNVGGASGSAHSLPHGSHHVGLASAAAHEAQLARQLLSTPSGERQSEGSRLAGYDEPFHGVLSGREDVSLSMHYESLLRAGYSSVLYKNAYAPSHTGSGGTAEAIVEAVAAGRRKESALREDGANTGSGQAGGLTSGASSAGASKGDETSPSAPKRKRHSSHAASRANKNERKSTGASGNTTRPTATEPPVSKKRRSDRSRLASLASVARRSNSVDSQELADEETITDTNAERNNSHPNRPRKTSYVSQQESSYDIDNIIPYGMMSCTRLVERLKYKEILTPKWRLVHIPPEESSAIKVGGGAVMSPLPERTNDHAASAPTSNRSETNSSRSAHEGEQSAGNRHKDGRIGVESGELAYDGGDDDDVVDVEDISDAALQVRHARQEALERERFSAYLKPKLSHQGGPSSSATSVSAGANSRRARTDSSTENNNGSSTGGGSRSKEFSSSGASSKVKELDESATPGGSDRGVLTPAAGGKVKEDTVSNSHSTKAKRQHRSLSQDWTMLQSSSAPTPYAPRQFPLSDADWERMQNENSVQSDDEMQTATGGDKDDKTDSSLQDGAVFADDKEDVELQPPVQAENNKRTHDSTGRHGRQKHQRLVSNLRTGGTPEGLTPVASPDTRGGVKKQSTGELDLGAIQAFELSKVRKQLDSQKLAPRTRSSPVIGGNDVAGKVDTGNPPLPRWLDNDKSPDPDLLEELANAEWSTEEDVVQSD